jgi:hypothetical protein
VTHGVAPYGQISILKSGPVRSFAFSVMQLDQDQLLLKLNSLRLDRDQYQPVYSGLVAQTQPVPTGLSETG